MTTQLQYEAAVVSKARSELGVPYVYGKTDCEWLTRTCAAAIGVVIPEGSSEQWLDPRSSAHRQERTVARWLSALLPWV